MSSPPIVKIGEGMPIAELVDALDANPQVWNTFTKRTDYAASPHREVDDIWVRYGHPDESLVNGFDPHESYWWAGADMLPVRPIATRLMASVGGTRLGGILITRVPAGKQVYPHIDHGWHARYYEKFAVQIQSAPGQRFCFHGAQLEPRPGDVYWFDNAFEHWVENPTEHDRITLIVCIRRT